MKFEIDGKEVIIKPFNEDDDVFIREVITDDVDDTDEEEVSNWQDKKKYLYFLNTFINSKNNIKKNLMIA